MLTQYAKITHQTEKNPEQWYYLYNKKLKSLQRRVRTTIHINITQLKLQKNKKKVIIFCNTSPECQSGAE